MEKRNHVSPSPGGLIQKFQTLINKFTSPDFKDASFRHSIAFDVDCALNSIESTEVHQR
jgi:hypothetical protein